MRSRFATKRPLSRVSTLVVAACLLVNTGEVAYAQIQNQSQTPYSSAAPETELPDSPGADLQTKWVEFEGTLRLDNDLNPDAHGDPQYNLRTQRFETQTSFRLPGKMPERIAKQILFIIRTRMEQNVIVDGKPQINYIPILDHIKEVYIEIKQVGGLPIAVVWGSTEVAYGQDYPGTIDLQNDAAHGMTDPDRGQVKGFTLALDKKLIPFFDKVEANFFSPNPKLTSAPFSHFDGLAFRLTKNLNKYFSTEVSILRKGNSYDPSLEPEADVSFGGVYQRGAWTFWGEGIKMDHAQKYPDAPLGGTMGMSRELGPGEIDLEGTGIKNTLSQYALGYKLFVTKNWSIGPTFRYTVCRGGDAGCVAARGYGEGPSMGVAVRYNFGGGGGNLNHKWLRKKSDPGGTPSEKKTVEKVIHNVFNHDK